MPQGRKPPLTKAQLLAAIKGSDGILAQVARKAKRDRGTVRKYVDRWPEARAALKEEQETMLDLAQKQLSAQVKAGESWAIKFTLATLGKTRGFTERQEVEHSGAIVVQYDDALRDV